MCHMSQELLLSIVGAKKCRWPPLQAQRQALIVTICHTRSQFKNCRSKWEQGGQQVRCRGCRRDQGALRDACSIVAVWLFAH